MVLHVKFLLGLAHISRRQIQVVNSESGRISVFHGAGHEQNVQREPLIIAHGHNHYTVSKSSLLCLPYLHIHMYFILGLAQHINFWFHFPVVIFLKNLMKTEKFA